MEIQWPDPHMTDRTSLGIRHAAPYDYLSILNLLATSNLPQAGVWEWLDSFFVAEAGNSVIGTAGLEVYGAEGVLRSVAVTEPRRGNGIGRMLTDTVIDHARASGVHRLFLLTPSAEGYFARRGFRGTQRVAASIEVRRSVEFREACPTSATAMVLDLQRAWCSTGRDRRRNRRIDGR